MIIKIEKKKAPVNLQEPKYTLMRTSRQVKHIIVCTSFQAERS